jgi:ribosome-binding factor A
VLGDDAQAEETKAALRRAASRVRAVVGEQVRLKYLPELHFEPDTAIEQGIRIERILRELGEDRSEAGDEEGSAEGS